MAAKRVDPLKAKEAKQKKIAIGGAVLLLGLLAMQGPKTMKMLQGPQPIESTAPAATTSPAGTPAAPAGGAVTPGAEATAAAAAPATDLALVADSDQPPVVEVGQIATFELFESKDPFAQQAETPAPPAAPAELPADAPTLQPGGTITLPLGDGAGEPGGTAAGGFTSGGTSTSPTTTTPAPPVLAAATSIAVNGVAEDVKVEAPFPAEEPTFVLASVAENGKSVRIGIAGGNYADGGETIELKLGKKVTLQNTADGSRYELELRSIEGQPLPKRGS